MDVGLTAQIFLRRLGDELQKDGFWRPKHVQNGDLVMGSRRGSVDCFFFLPSGVVFDADW